ncbi:hypothetical protein BJX64DRAFT_294908 [Aspergillus heterothallicus]
MSTLNHIVLFRVQRPEDLQGLVDFIKKMQSLSLRDGKPYIAGIECGTTRPYAPVRSLGYNFASILRFRSDEDRVYFLQDRVHTELIEFVRGKLLGEVLVLDFMDGVAQPIEVASC